jgi:hypothetical protein
MPTWAGGGKQDDGRFERRVVPGPKRQRFFDKLRMTEESAVAMLAKNHRSV